MFKQFRGLPRQIYLLSLVRAIMAMGTFVFAFVSLMVTNNLGLNEFQAGNVMLIMAVANVAGSLYGGQLADLFGRKRMFIVSIVFAVVTVVAAGFFPQHVAAIAFVAVSYAFNVMTIPILAAMITDNTDETNRTESFSLLYLAQNIGYAVGPSIGGILYYNYVEWAFWGQGILYALSGLGMYLLVTDLYVPLRKRHKSGDMTETGGMQAENMSYGRITAGNTQVENIRTGDRLQAYTEPETEARTDTNRAMGTDNIVDRNAVTDEVPILIPGKVSQGLHGSEESLLDVLLHMPLIFFFVIGLVILTMCYQEINFMLPLQLSELFGLEYGSRYSGFVWTVNGIVCVLLTPLIISLTKRNNQLLNIAFASLLYAVGFGMNGIGTKMWVFYLAAVVWTMGEILISTGAGVFVAEYAPPTHRARFQSLYEIARGFGRGIGPNLFGFYLLTHSYFQAWTIVAVVCLGAIFFMLALYFAERKMKAERQTL